MGGLHGERLRGEERGRNRLQKKGWRRRGRGRSSASIPRIPAGHRGTGPPAHARQRSGAARQDPSRSGRNRSEPFRAAQRRNTRSARASPRGREPGVSEQPQPGSGCVCVRVRVRERVCPSRAAGLQNLLLPTPSQPVSSELQPSTSMQTFVYRRIPFS